MILDRERHAELISQVRDAGARIKLITDGDVAGAIMAAREGTGVDLLLGIGGTPEGIIAACAIKCLGGVMLGKLAPRNEEERDRAIDAGHDLDRVLTTEDLVSLGRRVLRRDRYHRRRPAAGRPVQVRRRDHAHPGDAGPLRHHPQRAQRARAVEGFPLLGRALLSQRSVAPLRH